MTHSVMLCLSSYDLWPKKPKKNTTLVHATVTRFTMGLVRVRAKSVTSLARHTRRRRSLGHGLVSVRCGISTF